MTDEDYMQQAIALARRKLGRTAPNPPVGCVIVKAGKIISQGATGDGGRPHAEEQALIDAGEAARGADVYVTLEPCHSRSSGALGCSDRLINAGVARVVAAMSDPHPTAMDGFANLKLAGVQVDVGVCAKDARVLVEGFFKRLETGRPLVVQDKDTSSYDAVFDQLDGETLEAALVRAGEAGLTRICVAPGSDHARQLSAAGLIDRVQPES